MEKQIEISERERFSGCTVVSLVPFEITEYKPGLIPGTFIVPASDGDTPAILHVRAAKHNVYLDSDRGSLPIRDAADEVANSIVRDFVDGQLGRKDGAQPGIFWVPGSWSTKEVQEKFAHEITQAKIAQKRWFIEICQIADNDWNRYHQHNVISDFQRKAAELLGYKREEHEWMSPATHNQGNIRCPNCTTLLHPEVAFCPSCKCIINKEKYQTLEFAK